MIPSVVLKFILPKVMDHIMKVIKLDKVLRYVEEENEVDVAVKNVEKKCLEIDRKLKAMKSVLKELDNVAHKPIDDLTDRLKNLEKVTEKVKKLRAFKSLGK